MRRAVDVTLCVLAAILLGYSLQPGGSGLLIWVGLVPLLLVLVHQKPLQGAGLAWICGLVFYPIAGSWILVISGYSYFHHILLDLYFGSYFAVFGLMFCFIVGRLSPLAAFTAAPFLWVLLEYVKSNFFFLALPWMLLGYSQTEYPLVIQSAALTGPWGVSFVIGACNCALATALYAIRHPEHVGRFQAQFYAVAALGLLLVNLGYGWTAMQKAETRDEDKLRMALIQGNFPPDVKWDRKSAPQIADVYLRMSRESLSYAPGLIVWPETTIPGPITTMLDVRSRITDMIESSNVPLLLGISQIRKIRAESKTNVREQNSALLIHPFQSKIPPQIYNKSILLPFFEYMPFRNFFLWKWLGIPNFSGYVPGEGAHLLNLNGTPFGVLICWESMFPDYFRYFVLKGSRFIINITDEAWVGGTKAPHQVLQMNIFRAVENGVWLVRCANTGISCFIDPNGHVVGRVRQMDQDVLVRGALTGTVSLSNGMTFYTRYGDWFALLCALYSCVVLLLAWRRKAWDPRVR